MRQKSQKTDENQGGEQKTQWDSNNGGVGGAQGTSGEGWAAILGSHILRTYLQQKGQGGWWWWRRRSGRVGGGLVWGGVHLHRSTGLRSWTARDRGDGALSVGLLHPLLSSRECISRRHSLSGKTEEQNNTSHKNIKQKGIREETGGWAKVQGLHLENPEASVDLTSMWHPTAMMSVWRANRRSLRDARRVEVKLLMGRGRVIPCFHSQEQFGGDVKTPICLLLIIRGNQDGGQKNQKASLKICSVFSFTFFAVSLVAHGIRF